MFETSRPRRRAVRRAGQHTPTGQQLHHDRRRRGRDRSPRLPAVHGVGGHRNGVGPQRRRPKIVSAQRAAIEPRGAQEHLLRPDQRQPHRLQQGSEQGRRRRRCSRRSRSSTRCRRRRRSCCTPATSRSSPSPRSSTPRIRCSRAQDATACSTFPASTTSPPTTARRISQRYGKGTKGGGWYSFDHSGVHFIGLVNVLNLKAGGLGSLGAEQIAWLEEGRRAAAEQHADRAVRARAAVDRLSRMGLGHRRFRAGARAAQALRIGDGAQRPHPPDHAEGGRQHVVSHGDVDGVSAAGAGHRAGARPDEGRAGATQERARHRERHVHSRAAARSPSSTRRCPAQPPAFEAASHDAMTQTPSARTARAARPERDRHRQLQLHAADAHREGRHEGHVDQQRRRAAPHRERAAASSSSRRCSTPISASA